MDFSKDGENAEAKKLATTRKLLSLFVQNTTS